MCSSVLTVSKRVPYEWRPLHWKNSIRPLSINIIYTSLTLTPCIASNLHHTYTLYNRRSDLHKGKMLRPHVSKHFDPPPPAPTQGTCLIYLAESLRPYKIYQKPKHHQYLCYKLFILFSFRYVIWITLMLPYDFIILTFE